MLRSSAAVAAGAVARRRLAASSGHRYGLAAARASPAVPESPVKSRSVRLALLCSLTDRLPMSDPWQDVMPQGRVLDEEVHVYAAGRGADVGPSFFVRPCDMALSDSSGPSARAAIVQRQLDSRSRSLG